MGIAEEFVMENLWCKIERLRQRMHVAALEKGISHPDVLMVSQRLDKVINEFYKTSLQVVQDEPHQHLRSYNL